MLYQNSMSRLDCSDSTHGNTPGESAYFSVGGGFRNSGIGAAIHRGSKQLNSSSALANWELVSSCLVDRSGDH